MRMHLRYEFIVLGVEPILQKLRALNIGPLNKCVSIYIHGKYQGSLITLHMYTRTHTHTHPRHTGTWTSLIWFVEMMRGRWRPGWAW